MPLWVAAILGGFVQAAGTLVGRVLLSLGIGYFTFTGLDLALTWMRDYAFSKLAGMGSVTVSVLSTMQVGTAISIVSSALAARLLLDGMTGGSITRMVVKG